MSSVEGALSSVRPSSQEIHMIQVIDIEYIMWTDLCVCILTGFNEPLCSWFTYSSTMFYTWPQGSSRSLVLKSPKIMLISCFGKPPVTSLSSL